MLDFLSQLRLKSIFDPQVGNDLPSQGGITGQLPRPPIGQTMPTMEGDSPLPMGPGAMGESPIVAAPSQNPFNPNAPGPTQPPIVGGMSDYKPEHDAKDRLDELLNTYPVYQKPGWLRAIAAGLAATGTHRPQDIPGMMHGKYNRELADWKTKATFAEKAADNENQRNVNNRTLAYQTIQARLKEEAQEAKEANDAKKLEIAQHRASIYEFKATHPNIQFSYPKGGTIHAYDPATKELKDTGIPTGSATDLDKLMWGHEYRTEENEQKGKIRSDQINQQGEIESEHIVERGQQARETATTRAANLKSLSPTQRRMQEYNNARQIVSENPALGKHIKLGKPGEFRIAQTGQGWTGAYGPTPEERAEINEIIYGDPNGPGPDMATSHGASPVVTPPTSPTVRPPGTAPTTGTTGQTPLKPGYVRVIMPDGKSGQYPRNKLSQLPKGAKVVGE